MESSLTIGPMIIGEPATVLTDYLMAAVAIWFVVDLGRRGRPPHAIWWRRAFALLAAGALAGGTYHALQGSLPPWTAGALWRFTLAGAALTSYATMRAAAHQWLGPGAQSLWAGIAGVKLAATLLAGLFHAEFLVAVLDFGATMSFVTAAAIAGRRRHPRAFALVAASAALFVAGALVQQARVAPHPWFNHNDLFHVIQTLANGCLYLAARSRGGAGL